MVHTPQARRGNGGVVAALTTICILVPSVGVAQFLDITPYNTTGGIDRFKAGSGWKAFPQLRGDDGETGLDIGVLGQIGFLKMVPPVDGCASLGTAVVSGEAFEFGLRFSSFRIPPIVVTSTLSAEKDAGNCATTVNLVSPNGGIVSVGPRLNVVTWRGGKSKFAVWLLAHAKLTQYVNTADSSYNYEWGGYYSLPILLSGEVWGRRAESQTKNNGVFYLQAEPFYANPSDKLIAGAYGTSVSGSFWGFNGTFAINIEGLVGLVATYMWIPSETLAGNKRLLLGIAKKT